MDDYLDQMVQTDNIQVIMRGLADFSYLKGADKFKFDHLMLALLNMGESIAFSNDILNNEDATMDMRCVPAIFPSI